MPLPVGTAKPKHSSINLRFPPTNLQFEADHRELHIATTTYTFNSPPIFRTSFKLYKGNLSAGTSLRSRDARSSIPFLGFLVLKQRLRTHLNASRAPCFLPFLGFFALKPISIFSRFQLSSPTYSPLRRPLRLSLFCKGIYKYNRKTATQKAKSCNIEWRARWGLNLGDLRLLRLAFKYYYPSI